eukprot:Em0017g107a
MADPVRLVCSVCYKVSSHKSNPTLTPESKAISDGKTKTCGVCRQEWVPIRIAEEIGGQGKLVIIRPRPKNVNPAVDYQLCNRKEQCTKRDQCSFAHSNVELAAWNREREKMPRVPPRLQAGQQFMLCQHMGPGRSCPYGLRCTYAHSDEELKEWNRLASENPQPLAPTTGPTTGPRAHTCSECSVQCTSKQQLDQHMAAKHGGSYAGPPGGVPPPIRPRPHNPPPPTGYRMCLHVENGRRCGFGDNCSFAHSPSELDAWNRQAAAVPGGARFHHPPPPFQRPPFAAPYAFSRPPPPPHAGPNFHPYPQHPQGFVEQRRPRFEPSALDEFEDDGGGTTQAAGGGNELPRESETGSQTPEFAKNLRDRVLTDGNSTSFLETKNGVSIMELTRLGVNLKRRELAPLEWVFSISTTSPQHFKSVVLLDQLMTDYSIEGVRLLHPQGGVKFGHTNPDVGVVVSEQVTEWNIIPGEKAQVKIHLNPRAGILSQVVIFDFEEFYMVQGLTVHYLGEKEIKLLESIDKKPKPAKKDLYWEQRHEKVPYPLKHDEEGDTKMQDYPLPEKVETLLEQGKYNNVENKITKENYKRRMHNLLYLEEYQQRKDMSRYDLYDIEVTLQEQWEDAQKGVVYAPSGFSYIVLTIDEVLYEGGRSIKPSDWAYLHPVQKNFIFECYVDHVGKDTVVLKITEKAAQACKESMNRCSIRFILGNVSMRAMHYAVDQLDLEVLYGTQSATPTPSPAGIKRCLDDLAKLELYDKQKNAIRGMLEPLYQKVPSLVLGPFGCGKTRTLSECIKLLTLYVPEARILVCAHSNSAADLYVENMSREWRRRGLQKAPLFRLYFTGRKLNTISPIVKEYCNIKKDWPVIPSLDELKQYKVVVSTLMTARTLSLMEMSKGWFTHIFIDEAAQALEAECLIPLCLANSKTKVILAGDHMQLDPPVYSPMARKYGLQQSLLERLFDSDMYKKDSPLSQYCKVQLTENYRSCEKIMGLLSKLFYNNELICKTTFDPPANLPPTSFVGVDGSESQDEGSPSYYNVEEAVEVARQVKRLVEKGIRPGEVCVLSFYTGQIQHIRQVLRSDRLGEVVVRRVDDVQGNEFRALIVSTVRTCADVSIPEEEIDFLSNPKLFVTALTRAREVLIVVGDPATLCSVGLNRRYWVEYVLQCATMRSFIYQKPDVFLQQMRARLTTKQLLAKNSKKLPPSSSAPQNMATSAPQATPPAPPTSATSATFLQSPPQTQQQMIRDAVAQNVTMKHDTVINQIVDQFRQLKVEQLKAMMENQDFFTYKVREMEGIIRSGSAKQAQPPPVAALPAPVASKATTTPLNRNGATSTTVHSCWEPVLSDPSTGLGGDLPPFLASMVDALTQYSKFCDNFLQHPLSPDARSSIEKQKANVMDQIRLTNDQIVHYRNFMKILEQAAALAKAATAFGSTILLQPTYPVGGVVGGLGDFQYGATAPVYSSGAYFSMSQDTRGLTQTAASNVRFGRSEGNGISQPNGQLSQLQGQKEANDLYQSDDEFD